MIGKNRIEFPILNTIIVIGSKTSFFPALFQSRRRIFFGGIGTYEKILGIGHFGFFDCRM
jgi:hypothetical protein